MDTLAKRLAWARAKKELSQQELAQKSGVKQGTIGNLEAGIRGTARRITSIADALGVDASWLATGDGRPFPSEEKENVTYIERVNSEEMELLEAYRLTKDEEGRQSIMSAANAVQKVDLPLAARHQG